jgi:hypothetical protein
VITVTLTPTQCEALAVDDREGVVAHGHGLIVCTPTAARELLEDAVDRSTRDGGYDQPLSWYGACRGACKRLRRAITEAAPPAAAKVAGFTPSAGRLT